MKLEGQQILSLFIKVMRKFYKYLYSVASKEIESTLPRLREVNKWHQRNPFFLMNNTQDILYNLKIIISIENSFAI